MSVKKPLVLNSNGSIEQLQNGDTLNAAVSTLDSIALTNGESGAVVIATPVYIQAENTVKKAAANASGTAKVFGLISDTSVAGSASGNVQTDGPLVATTAQWDAVAGTTGGLTPGSTYFLGATAGTITATAPTATGSSVVAIGNAISATELDINLGAPILL